MSGEETKWLGFIAINTQSERDEAQIIVAEQVAAGHNDCELGSVQSGWGRSIQALLHNWSADQAACKEARIRVTNHF